MRKNSYSVLLQGGIGNQLFQYVFAKYISKTYLCNVSLDLSAFQIGLHKDQTASRKFALEHVVPDGLITSKFSIHDLRQARIWNSNCKRPWRLLRLGYAKVWFFHLKQILTGTRVVTEKSWLSVFRIWPMIAKQVIFDGFWQDQKYASYVETELRDEFTLEPRCCRSIVELQNLVHSENSLAVHIRRGDYATNLDAMKFHGLLSIDYFVEAISLHLKDSKIDAIYVFSDNPEWCKDNLKIDRRLNFISDLVGPVCDFDELLLMSACSHFVISNSTFSWWAAWLSNVDGRDIIAPSDWFADNLANQNSKGLVPNNWRRLPAKFEYSGAQ